MKESSNQSVSSLSSEASSLGSSSNKNLINQASRQLKIDEGVVLHAYQDHLGFWTIGIGRLIDRRKNGCISLEEAEYLLNNDIQSRLNTLQKVLPWFDLLDEARKGVLLNMSFQLGVGGLLGFKKTLGHVKAGEYTQAAEAMLQSKWATQTPARAKRLSDQMRYGKWHFGKA